MNFGAASYVYGDGEYAFSNTVDRAASRSIFGLVPRSYP
jgi:hypothetical protein